MNQLKFTVDPAKCIRCGACIRDCAPAILKFGVSGFPELIEGEASSCTKCQHCLAVCPEAAVSIFGREPGASLPVEQRMDSDRLLSLIAGRRSFRSYRRENLDRDILEKLLSMLAWVPTGVNSHSLDFSVVSDLSVMDEIRSYVNSRILEMMKFDPPPAAVKGLMRYRRQILEGRDVIFRGAPHMIVVSAKEDSPCPAIDPMIALSYFELYAQSLGVGTVWCGLAMGMLLLFPELRTRIGIPEGWRPGYVMLFGPTDLRYPRATQPEAARIHFVK